MNFILKYYFLVVEPGTTGWHRIQKCFGDQVLNSDKTMNREKLGEIIFHDNAKRKLLNQCLHKLIMFEMAKQIVVAFFSGYKFIILDVPLLFETNVALKFIRYKVVVNCDNDNEQLRRLLKRNPNLTEQEAKLRIQSQMSSSERVKLADFVIDNSGDLKNTQNQIKNLTAVFNASNSYLTFRIGLTVLIVGLFYFIFNKN